MEIEIRLEQTRPPAGTIRSSRHSARVFHGWLGMLRELSVLLEADHSTSDQPAHLSDPDQGAESSSTLVSIADLAQGDVI